MAKSSHRIQYRCPLTGRKRSLLFPSAPEAEVFRVNMKGDIAALKGGRMTLSEFKAKWEARTPVRSTTIAHAVDLWRSHLTTGKSKKTGHARSAAHVYDTTMAVIRIATACKIAYVSDLTPDAVTEHFDRLDGQNRNLHRSALESFLDYLVCNRRQVLRENPFVINGRFVIDAVTVKTKNPSRALTPVEAEALFDAASPTGHDLPLRLRYTTGLRRSELAKLRWGDLDIAAQTIHIDGDRTKNHKAAIIPLDPSLIGALTVASFRAERGALMFPSYVDPANARRRWKRLVKRAGIAWLAPLADDPDQRDGRADEKSLRVSFNNGVMAAMGVSDESDILKLMMRHRVGLAHSVYANPSALLDAKRDALDRFLAWHNAEVARANASPTLALTA